MGEVPLTVGATQVTIAEEAPAVAVTVVGGPGVAVGSTAVRVSPVVGYAGRHTRPAPKVAGVTVSNRPVRDDVTTGVMALSAAGMYPSSKVVSSTPSSTADFADRTP